MASNSNNKIICSSTAGEPFFIQSSCQHDFAILPGWHLSSHTRSQGGREFVRAAVWKTKWSCSSSSSSTHLDRVKTMAVLCQYRCESVRSWLSEQCAGNARAHPAETRCCGGACRHTDSPSSQSGLSFSLPCNGVFRDEKKHSSRGSTMSVGACKDGKLPRLRPSSKQEDSQSTLSCAFQASHF